MKGDKDNLKEELRYLILQKEKEGKVCFMTVDGLASIDTEEFIKQPTEGLLYDLNRDKVTILSFMDEPKWVNDYAVALVISKLKDDLEKIYQKNSIINIKEYSKSYLANRLGVLITWAKELPEPYKNDFFSTLDSW